MLLAASSFAQSKVDFSGIFLRTETEIDNRRVPAVPRILQITQTASELTATATQNGETAVVHYRLEGKTSDEVKARLTNTKFTVRASLPRDFFPVGSIGSTLVPENIQATWELSPDSQHLVIHRKSDTGISSSEFFTREASLEAAKAAATSGLKIECDNAVSRWIRKHQSSGEYAEGAFLGLVSFAQITRCVSYDAGIFGTFFKNLEADRRVTPPRFLRNRQDVSSYSGDLLLEIQPSQNQGCSPESSPWLSISNQGPELINDLRFMVRWVGSSTRDLGEVQSEFINEPLQELNPPKVFYRMTIPAAGVPLTDDLEVLIFSKSGEQLPCVKGHI